MLCITYFKREHSKYKNKHRREEALRKADETMAKALEAQRNALELKKQGMVYPGEWALDAGNVVDHTDDAGNVVSQVQMPVDGLVTVPQNSAEYWDVHDELTRTPDARFQQTNGQQSDLRGMHDAWITKLERIQNTDLYANFDTMKDKLKRTNENRESEEVVACKCTRNPHHSLISRDVASDTLIVFPGHGTGNFDAANIYEDKQDGFMMQFASPGQWGRGLYFADEAGYSTIYASAAAGMPDGGQSRGFQNDEKEMMLATLLLGDVIEMDRDTAALNKACSELKTPPAIAGCEGKSSPCRHDGMPTCTAPPTIQRGDKYNTVRGYTQTDQRAADGTWSKNPTCPRSKVRPTDHSARPQRTSLNDQ